MTITFLWIFIVEISFRITIFNNVQNKWQTLNLRAWYLNTKASAYIWLAAVFSWKNHRPICESIYLYMKAITSIWKHRPTFYSNNLHRKSTTYIQGHTRRGLRPPPPSTRAPSERLRGGIHGGGSFNIKSACISLPQVRHSGVPRGAVVLLPPPGSSRLGTAPLENTKLKGNYV